MIYDITFAACMIQMLLLLFRKESFLVALIVEYFLAQWERNISQQKLVELKLPRVMERERVARQALKANNIVFYVHNDANETVSEYKYLGCILSADDKDDAAVSYNIKKASNAWFGMYRILSADGANAHVMAQFYLAIIQAKLLFGSETWVLSQKALEKVGTISCSLCSLYNATTHSPPAW